MAETRDRLIAATNELFRRHGYNGTGLKDVTRSAGATTGSLYHFFPGGKSELAAAVVTETGAAYQALYDLIATEAPDPAAGVVALFDGAADVLVDTDYIDPCPIGTVAREVASTDDALRSAADAVFRGWIGAGAARFEAAGLPSEDAADLAATVVAAVEGGFIVARVRRDHELLRAIGRQMGALVEARLAAVSSRP